MKPIYLTILTLALAGVVSYATTKIVQPNITVNSSITTAKEVKTSESVYERVMRTGVLRCAYLIWPPFMDQDLITNKLSGFNHDMVTATIESLGLTVEWSTEFAPGDQVTTLQTGKADAICAADGPINPRAGRHLHYTRPMALIPLYAYVRVDDTRFDNDFEKLNNKNTKFTVIDGDIVDLLARGRFPKATIQPLQHLNAPGQMMLDVMTNKADAIVNDPLTMADFEKTNPNKIKRLGTKPLTTFPNSIAVLRDEDGLKLTDLLNRGLANIHNYKADMMIMNAYSHDGKNPFIIPDVYE